MIAYYHKGKGINVKTMKYYYLAQAYGSGNYNESTYTGTTQTTQTGTGTSTSAGGATNGSLANTGIYVLAIVSVACFIIFLALVVRLMRRKKQARRTDLPATIPGESPIDTPQAASTSQTENSQPTKRIDF
jgi:hypothetical protein